MNENKVKRIEDSERIRFSPRVLNRFLDLFLRVRSVDQSPKKPKTTLRRYLKRARHIEENYYFVEKWIFKIKDNILLNIFLVPEISLHAKKRLYERFDVAKINEKIRLSIALHLIRGSICTKKQIERLGLRRQSNTKIVKDRDCVFITTGDGRVLKTVIVK